MLINNTLSRYCDGSPESGGKGKSCMKTKPIQTFVGTILVLAASAQAQSTQRWVADQYGKLPIVFEMNSGQTDHRVKFLSRGSDYTLFLTGQEAVVALKVQKEAKTAARKSESAVPSLRFVARNRGESSNTGHIDYAALRMTFVGAKREPQLTGLEEMPAKVNYLVGNDPRKWHNSISTYSKVRYQGIYPGIDLIYRGDHRQLEYDFLLSPAADAKAIGIEFNGAETLKIDARGNLVVQVAGRKLRQPRPTIYQEIGGVRHKVSGGYVLRDARRVGFRLGSYDRHRPVVIDPVLAYSTFLSGSVADLAKAITVDSAGNAYVTGQALSPDFPTTPGAFQTMLRGSTDAFVTKLNADGSALLYSTYLGGTADTDQLGRSIAVDAAGSAYVAGQTTASDFPTTSGALQTSLHGQLNAFVTKLNGDGSALVYSTYLGGSFVDEGAGIAVDAAGHAYVTGLAASVDFPTTSGAFQTQLGGRFNAFVTNLNLDGSALAYSTYLGGSGFGDAGNGIVVDSAGSAYVAGLTNSDDFPTTPSAFQTTLGGNSDAFVTKFNADGSALVYSTYLGGIGDESANGIALDSAGGVYVAGSTESGDFPTTAAAFQTGFGGRSDCFVTKLSANGSALLYSTYIGGTGFDECTGIALDGLGKAYVVGNTQSVDFQTTANAFQTTLSGPADALVTVVTADGSALTFSTYLSGSGGSQGSGIAIDQTGNAYVTGLPGSTDFPTTPGAFQTSFPGAASFVTKIDFSH